MPAYDKKIDLQSSVKDVGDIVTQIIHFKDGSKRTFNGVITSTLSQGQFTHFELLNGSHILIHDINVLCIEVFPERGNE
jgi:hypothetical protein